MNARHNVTASYSVYAPEGRDLTVTAAWAAGEAVDDWTADRDWAASADAHYRATLASVRETHDAIVDVDVAAVQLRAACEQLDAQTTGHDVTRIAR